MSGFVAIPDEELPAVFKALEEGKCVSCYGDIKPNDTQRLYCHECDPDESCPECGSADVTFHPDTDECPGESYVCDNCTCKFGGDFPADGSEVKYGD